MNDEIMNVVEGEVVENTTGEVANETVVSVIEHFDWKSFGIGAGAGLATVGIYFGVKYGVPKLKAAVEKAKTKRAERKAAKSGKKDNTNNQQNNEDVKNE